MRLRSLLFSVVALSCAPVEGQSGWLDFKGELVPEIAPWRWVNVDGPEPTRESLMGRVWLLEFFSTGSSECMRKVKDLSKLHDEFGDRGFRIVAISSEVSSKLKREMVERRKVGFWIASDPRNDTMDEFVTEGVLSYPRFYLVNAWGRVVGHEIPTPEQLEELLEDVFVAELDREMPAVLGRAEQFYKDGAYSRSWRAAVKLTKSKEPIIQAEAGYLRDQVVDYGAFLQRTLPIAIKDDSPEQAYGRLLVVAAQFDGMELGTWAKKRLKELGRDKAVSRHQAAWRKLADAVKKDLASGGKEYDRKRALKLYKQVIEKYALSGVPSHLARQRLQRFADLE